MKSVPKKHNLLCIVCPEGCEIEVREADGKLSFSPGICKRGRDYAKQEIRDPSRILTTTVPISGGDIAMLPVRTAAPIPKPSLISAMDRIREISTVAPVKVGDVVIEDLVGTGVSLLASRSVGRVSAP